MVSVKRNKKSTDDLLDKMCGKEAVAEKFKSDISAKVKNIPQDESNVEDKKQAVVDEQILVDKNSPKSQFNSNEKKQVADNIVKSVMSYKDEQEKILSEKEKKTGKKQEATNNNNSVSLVYNCPLPAGTIIDGRYQLQGKPRQGGFGMTYLATRVGENDGALVVVKELYPYNAQRDVKTGVIQINYEENEGLELKKNFEKEAERIQKLKEKKPQEIKKMNLVITKTNAFKYNGNWYYVMEYVPGNSLADIMFSFKDNNELFNCLPAHYRFQIMDQLCNALQNLHEIGCVHQDINPNNIMIDFDDADNVYLKVIDYGLATNLYSFGDMSRSCIRYAGTHGFSDVLTQFAEYEKISNEIETATMNGDEDKAVRLTKKLKTIDVYSCGAILGYLFLLNIDFIKKTKFNVEYELVISKNALVQPFEIDWSEDNIVIANKYKANLIKKLVSDATVRNLDKRIQSIDEFRKRLHEIMLVDEELIRRMKLMAEIELWKKSSDSISSYVTEFKNEVEPLVSQSINKKAQEFLKKGVSILENADKEKDAILQMEIKIENDLDDIVERIKSTNTQYQEAETCLEEARKLVIEGDPFDDKIVKIQEWLRDTPVKADKIKLFGDDVKSKVQDYKKAMDVWYKGSELMTEAEQYRAEIAKVRLFEASNEELDTTLQKTGLADTRYTMAENKWKEAKRVKQYNGWVDKLLILFWSVLVVVAIGVGGKFGWDHFYGDNSKSKKEKVIHTDNPQRGGGEIKPEEPEQSEQSEQPEQPEEPEQSEQLITKEYLNEIFEKAQQNDSTARQRIKEIIDDKVAIIYIEGETPIHTYGLSTFLARGNNKYIIGKTHKINRFSTSTDGKVITIILEKLN